MQCHKTYHSTVEWGCQPLGGLQTADSNMQYMESSKVDLEKVALESMYLFPRMKQGKKEKYKSICKPTFLHCIAANKIKLIPSTSHRQEKGYFVGFSKCTHRVFCVQIKTLWNLWYHVPNYNAMYRQKRETRYFLYSEITQDISIHIYIIFLNRCVNSSRAAYFKFELGPTQSNGEKLHKIHLVKTCCKNFKNKSKRYSPFTCHCRKLQCFMKEFTLNLLFVSSLITSFITANTMRTHLLMYFHAEQWWVCASEDFAVVLQHLKFWRSVFMPRSGFSCKNLAA